MSFKYTMYIKSKLLLGNKTQTALIISIFIHFVQVNVITITWIWWSKQFLLQKLKIGEKYYWCLLALWTYNKLYVKMTFLLFQSLHAKCYVFSRLACADTKTFAWHMPIQFFLYKYRILQIKWLTWPIDFMQKRREE